MFFVYRKKRNNYTPIEGIVTNWTKGFYRNTGSVIVKFNDEEYSTSECFSYEECKNLIGKNILFAIIDEKLFIYKVLE